MYICLMTHWSNNYSALDISQFFIKKGVSPLKLQKLLYYSQLWHIVRNKKNLFDDDIQAWIYGPVIKDVWDNFKYIRRADLIPVSKATDISYDDTVRGHLDNVWDSYGDLSASQLVDMTHSELPWIMARNGICDKASSKNVIKFNRHSLKSFKLDFLGNIPVAHGNPKATGRHNINFA